MSGERRDGHREALKQVGVLLKHSGVAFALGGGYAGWARGGPEPDHDVDFLLAEDDLDRAVAALAEGGVRVERPPEDWLVKAWVGEAMVDLIFRTAGYGDLRPLLERAEVVSVLSVRLPVLTATDLLACKLHALDEHQCDLARLIPVARAVREQVDWDRLAAETAGNDFAAVFLLLLRRLGVAPPGAEAAVRGEPERG